MIQRLDLSAWDRAPIYQNYLSVEFPYINIGARVDVTGLLAHCRREGLSFYFALVYTACRVADSIENFHYRFDDEGPFRVERNSPILTHLRPSEELFVMLEGPLTDDLRTFCLAVREMADDPAKCRTLDVEFRKDIINCSCLPWLDYTHFVRTIRRVGHDTNPKFSWGKYTTENGKTTLTFSIQVHHGLMDGYHVGLFYQRLQEALDQYQ